MSDQKQIKLKLFCDESASEGWLYFGILFVQELGESSFLHDLLNNRCSNSSRTKNWGECAPICSHHSKNNTEVHFKEILENSHSHKYDVASRWVDYFLQDVDNVYFYMLGIDLNNLDKTYFGDSRVEDNIYNRFFRTAILKAGKSFFNKYDNIVITDVIHDISDSKEKHKYFNWHPIFFINQNDSKVSVASPKITYVDSDHRKEKSHPMYSHFIQFVDLILGCARLCLDNTSDDKLKRKLAFQSWTLIDRLLNKPGNINSEYKYVNRLKIEFFPKHNLRNYPNEELRKIKSWDSFYTKREAMIGQKGQKLLPLIYDETQTNK